MDKRQCDILPAFFRERAAEPHDELGPRTQNNLNDLKAALAGGFYSKGSASILLCRFIFKKARRIGDGRGFRERDTETCSLCLC